jgi:transcriptional regulator with XRE-family HTH domain
MNIDNEFKSLIPALTADEHSELEASILREGCRDALVTWNGTLIDGHNRYEICTKHGLPFATVERVFSSRDDVIEWIILNQFGRRNLPAYERARLALRLKPVIAEKAKITQGTRTDLTSVRNLTKVDAKRELANVAGVSHDTIAKVETIEREAPAPIVEASRRGDISVNMAHSVTKMPEPDRAEITERIEYGEKPREVIAEVKSRPHVANNSGNNEWYTPSEYIEAAREVMGSIDLDPASCEIANKVVKANEIYTANDDGLTKTWRGNVWLNPPYAGDLIGKFADKVTQEDIAQAIILVNNATETQWFNTLISKASAVVFPKSRVKFYMPDGSTGAPLQGQAVIYIGDNAQRFVSVFKRFGWGALL